MQQKLSYKICTENPINNDNNNNNNNNREKETKYDKHVFRLKQKTLKIKRKKKHQKNIRSLKQATCNLIFIEMSKY